MVVKLNARLEGAAALFTELVTLEWDGPCIVMRGRSGDYIASGHMTPAYAMELHHRLGVLLQQGAEVVDIKPSARKARKRKKR
jgi:hypothetical protein